jgi:hypothetical protein
MSFNLLQLYVVQGRRICSRGVSYFALNRPLWRRLGAPP